MSSPRSLAGALRFRAFLRRAALLALLWWVLAEGEGPDSLLAVSLVLVAAGAGFILPHAPKRHRWRIVHVPRLVVYLLHRALAGGWDIARRAFSPSLPVRPAPLRLVLDLPPGVPTILFAWLVNLTPGTATVLIRKGEVVVHVLDTGMPAESQLRELEAHVKAVVAEAGATEAR